MIVSTALAALAVAQGTPSIQSFVQTGLKDATFVARVVKADHREMRKINDDFGQSYNFQTTTIWLKEPFKMRLEANVEDTKVLYIINGTTQYVRIPRAKINTRTNLASDPGRRQTPLDFGVLTPSLFDDLFVAKFVRWDRASGDAVFDLTYPTRFNYKARHRIWVDPQQKYVTKREWYNHRGTLAAIFYYEAPKQDSGVWVPSRITVRNADDKVAGITSYDSLKVNTGLDDSLFSAK